MRVLQTYLDGEADDDTAWRVARHVTDCDDCLRDADAINLIRKAVARLRTAPDPQVLVRLRTAAERLEREDTDP